MAGDFPVGSYAAQGHGCRRRRRRRRRRAASNPLFLVRNVCCWSVLLLTPPTAMETRPKMRVLALAALLLASATAHEHHMDNITEGHAISDDPIVRLYAACGGHLR